MNGHRVVAIGIAAASTLIAASWFTWPYLASSQNVVETGLDGQALVYMKDGAIDGCGVRVLVVDVPAAYDQASLITAYDVSFNLKPSGVAVVQARSTDATLSDYESGDKNRRKAVAPDKFWLKASGARATAPVEKMNGKMLPGADRGTVVYVSDRDSVTALFAAHGARKPITMGVIRPGMRTERVFSGQINMSDSERKQVAACLDRLALSTNATR
jgi:hypothetical protein